MILLKLCCCESESAFFGEVGSGSGIQSSRAFKFDRRGPRMLTVEAWRPRMDPERFRRPVVADLHHFETALRIRIWDPVPF